MQTRRRLLPAPRSTTRVHRARITAATHVIQAHQRTIAALQQIATYLLRNQPLQEVLQAVVQEVSLAMRFPIVAIDFYDAAHQLMECMAVTGMPNLEGAVGLRIPVDQSLAGQAARSGDVIIKAHVQNRLVYADAIFRQPGADTVVCLPLAIPERVIGTLTLAHPAAAPLEAHFVPLAQSLANLIATLVARRQADEHAINITTHKKVEAELQVALTKYRTLFDAFPLGVTVSDETGKIIETNMRAGCLLGLERMQHQQRMIDGTEWRIVRPDGSPMPAAEYASVRALTEQRIVENVEMGVITPGGETSWISVTAAPLPLDGYGVVITYGDVTARRRAEALVATQRDLARLIATVTEPEVAWSRCLELAARVCGMDCGGIYLFDADNQVLELVAHQGLGEEFVQATTRYAISTPQAQMMLAGESVYRSTAYLQHIEVFQHETLSCIAVMPIRYQGQVLGCVNLASHTLPDVPLFARQALETISVEIGNVIAALRTTATLRESRLRMELALKGANLGMWDWEVATGRAVFNERWAAIVGYTLVELAPLSFQTWTRLCHPDDLRRSEQLLQQHIAGATEFYECEIRMRHKNGSWVWVSSRGQVVAWDTAGKPLRMVGTHLDITARKQAELVLYELNEALEQRVAERTAALQASQERLTLATRSAGIGIWDWDIVANVLTWDQRMYELYGVSPDTFSSAYEAWFNGLHPDDRAEAERISLRSRRGEQEYDTEFRVCHPDGTVRTLKAHAIIQRSRAGEPLRMIGINFDITARKHAEEILRQANRDMLHATRMKDEFLANMSHELRSPLNVILGFSESLQSAVYGVLTERQQKAIHHIEVSGRHLLALINDILDLSKVEAGRLTLLIEPIKIVEICQASLLFVRELAARKSLKLTLQLSDPQGSMEADPKRLKQILINLLSNAVKFTPDGGQVHLEVSHDDAEELVRFAVRDTGIGIAPAAQEQLFQPFVQLDSSLSRQHEGTGLGLALVRRLAELHGGTVMVESTLGAGSCFTLVLPQHQPVPGAVPCVIPVPAGPASDLLQREPVTRWSHEPEASGMRILLAEDNEATVPVVEEYLQVKGFTVYVARTGREALALAIKECPDLILMDIQMPELDGLEVIRRLRTLPACATMPIIALTALAMASDRERCLAAGANAYLSKPVRMQDLVGLINQLLRL